MSQNPTPSLTVHPVHAVHPLQASKWLHVAALIEEQEMASLIQSLDAFYIYRVGCITQRGEAALTKEQFLEIYRQYIAPFRMGQLPQESLYRHTFSSAWTAFPEHVCSIDVGEGKQLARVIKPVVQLQIHQMHYSSEDRTFRSMTFGGEGILWGIQFSYPQMYKDFEEDEIVYTKGDFPNHPLFQKIQRWMRTHTVPTPFYVQEQKINVPARLGKECFSWINHHPHLQKKGVAVKASLPRPL